MSDRWRVAYFFIFFFKQKTAYEIKECDWSSDVCSSDLGNSAMATIVANTAVNNWFILKRGQAQGLSFSGISFSGAVLPLTAMFIMVRSDLSTAFLVIGAAIVLLSPVAWLVVRNRPEEYGLRPDGLPAKSTPPKIVQPPPGPAIMDEGIAADHDPSSEHWTFSMVIASGNFWKLGTAVALSMMGVLAVMFQLTPRFMDMGFSKQNAMYMMSLTALIGACGKYFWGSFCDRYEPRKVIALLMVANSIGLALGLVEGSFAATLLFVVVFGFAMGGVATAGPIMVAHLFGREAYASVARFMGFLGRMSILGYMIARESLRLTDSYDAAFVVFIILNLIAAALIISTKVTAPLLSRD